MSKAYVEIDFFEMERRSNASSKPSSSERAASSFRGGIQHVVSRINPLLLKTVMAGGAAGHARPSDNVAPHAWAMPSGSPSPSQTTSPTPLPLFNPAKSRSSSPAPDTAPLTIFYNGTVTAFDIPREKALAVMRMAETGHDRNPVERLEEYSMLDGNPPALGDLPIARRKSLQMFLEKRKERLVLASPYHTRLIPTPSSPQLETCQCSLGIIDQNQ